MLVKYIFDRVQAANGPSVVVVALTLDSVFCSQGEVPLLIKLIDHGCTIECFTAALEYTQVEVKPEIRCFG